jgi:hypothetical protein
MRARVRAFLIAAAFTATACDAVLGINLPAGDSPDGATPGSGDVGTEAGAPVLDGGADGTVPTPPHEPGPDATSPLDAPAGDTPDAPSGIDAPVTGNDAEAGPPPVCSPSADYQSDPNNCGRCGHDCGGSTCLAGKCQPYVVQDGQDYTDGLYVDSTGIYWISEVYDELLHCPITGCASKPATVAAQGSPIELVLANGVAFWESDQNTTSSLQSIPIANLGGAVVPFISRPGQMRSLAFDGADVFWTEAPNGQWQTYRCPASGCTSATPVFSDAVSAMVSDGTHLVWISGSIGLKVCTKANCHAQVLIPSGFASSNDLVLHDGVAYVADNAELGTQTGSITACPITATSCTVGNVAKGVPVAGGIAVDDSGIYWVGDVTEDAGSNTTETLGTIYTCPLTGCPASGPSVVIDGQVGGVGFLAVYGSQIYFTGGGSGSPNVMAIAKP